MCDFSLKAVRSRPAAVGDRLTSHDFGTGTRGFADPNDCGLAVCVKPGTEIAFDENIRFTAFGLTDASAKDCGHRTAIFRQINKDQEATHHDALELPDGKTIMLTRLVQGQSATVLQLPAMPKTAKEADEQKRAAYV